MAYTLSVFKEETQLSRAHPIDRKQPNTLY